MTSEVLIKTFYASGILFLFLTSSKKVLINRQLQFFLEKSFFLLFHSLSNHNFLANCLGLEQSDGIPFEIIKLKLLDKKTHEKPELPLF